MFKNYFKIAWRNLIHSKSFSIINITGLAIGIASAILILSWIQLVVSVDRFHAKLNRLYEVWSNDKIEGTIRSVPYTPELMAPTLKKDYPEIEKVTRVSWTRNLLSINGENKLMSTGAVVDPDFLQMFSFPLLSGNLTTALNDPQSIVIAKKLAFKLFNSENVIGKTITMGKQGICKVTGVLKDLPNNTMFNIYEYLCSYSQKGEIDRDWGNSSIPTFVLLKPNTSVNLANSKIKNAIPGHTSGIQKTETFLYPVSQLCLYSQFENGRPVGGRIAMVRIFTIIAGFILLIACINFMNLSTARSGRRAKEVGIRKVAGALRKSLIIQFLGESILMSFIAGLFAAIILSLSLHSFNRFTGMQLEIDYDNINFWLFCVAFILFTGILAGSFPAFVLSGFKPVSVLKGGFNKLNSLVTPRKVLVVLQFSFAITLIICTIIVTQQIKYAQNRKTGYVKEHLANVIIYNDDLLKNFQVVKSELLNSGTAVAVALVQSPLTSNWSSGNDLNWEGKSPATKVQINRFSEESDLVKAAGMQLVTGRDIDIKLYPSDSTACLINESALRLMNFKHPIAELIYDGPIAWHVVGVIKDYIQESPYQPIKPMIVKGPKDWDGSILIKLNGNRSTSQNIAAMEKIFKRLNPLYPFEYTFTDEDYAAKFADEQFVGKLAAMFAGLTIFIACLGLFGLATFMAQARVKEIGVRKVLGASAANITLLLSQDFVKLIVLAIGIATPVAWYSMNNWLSSYDYHVHIDWGIFVLSGALAILIAVLSVSYQSIRAAIANPVKSLRAE